MVSLAPSTTSCDAKTPILVVLRTAGGEEAGMIINVMVLTMVVVTVMDRSIR